MVVKERMLFGGKLLIYNMNCHKLNTNYQEIGFLDIREALMGIRVQEKTNCNLLIYNINFHKLNTNYSGILFLEIRESLMKIRVEEKKLEIFFSKMFAELKKVVLLPRNSQAEIAQLVEHDLAKVGVASSSLVFRSTRSRWKSGFFV